MQKPFKSVAGSMKKLLFVFNKLNRKNRLSIQAVITGLTALLFSCSHTSDDIRKVTERTLDYPTEHGFDIVLVYTDSAKKTAELEAPEVLRYALAEEPYVEYPQGVHVVFYNDSGFVKSTIDSEYAIQYDATGITEARKNVVVVNAKGEELKTEHLVWDENTEEIYSEEFVRITTMDKYIEGYGFRADQTFENWSMSKVSGTIQLKDE